MIWTTESVARALHAEARGDRTFGAVSTDTRTLVEGDLFVALVGEHFDGHDYLESARRAGAAGVVVRRGTPQLAGLAHFAVDDTLVALGRLARMRRRQLDGPVVAVTGTNGKTSTKEMLTRAVGTGWKVHATPANLNNRVGVPQTILAAPDDTEALVLEAGANEIGEIGHLRDIIEPTVAVVTNVAAGHLEGFGSPEVVLGEKVSLLDGCPTAVVGMRPPSLVEEARRHARRVVTAGTDAGADVAPDEWAVGEDGRVTFTFRGTQATLSVVGRHHLDNAMIALAVAEELSLDPARAAGALEQVQLPGGRCQVLRRGDLVILDDTYNANPESMKASLATAADLRAGRPFVAVVGTMLELGAASPRLHREAAEAILREEPALVGATGEFIGAFEALDLPRDRLVTSRDVEELGSVVRDRLHGGELVLVKASRGVRLERLIPLLTRGNEA